MLDYFFPFFLYLKSVTYDVAILCALILQYVYPNKVTLNERKKLKSNAYTVKTGLFSISLPQTVPLPNTDLLNTYLGNTVFVY